jgi:hypothetical protein
MKLPICSISTRDRRKEGRELRFFIIHHDDGSS